MFPSTFGKLLQTVLSLIEQGDKIMTLAQHPTPHHTMSTGLYNSLCYTNLGGRFIIYTGCPGGNVPDFGRMFLRLKFTDITQNTYIRS
jgi:hypothetical protein